MPTHLELLLRLLLAAGLCGLLGVEREITEQPAGFRTHIVVGLGTALFAIVSAFGFQSIVAAGSNPAVHVDVARVASQIVVGIGFLGGGAILKYGTSVRGLTTAAGLWMSAAVGTAVGLGMPAIAAETTAIALLALTGLRPARTLLRRFAVGREEFTIEAEAEVDLSALVQLVRRSGGFVQEVHVTGEGELQSIRLVAHMAAGQLPAKNIIHVPTMEEPGMMIGAENVRRAARAALIAADRNNFKVIAIPGIGTDLGNVPIDEAARAIVEEIRAHRRPCPETIYLVDTNDEMVAALEDALRNAQANL